MLHRYPSPILPFTLINNYVPTEATFEAALPSNNRDKSARLRNLPIVNTTGEVCMVNGNGFSHKTNVEVKTEI